MKYTPFKFTLMKTMKINVPEGYEIDKENSTFENIVFKEIKNKLPISWEELKYISGAFVDYDSMICYNESSTFGDNRNIFPSTEEAEAMLAMAQLCQLRDRWNEGWKPDWCKDNECKYIINNFNNTLNAETAFLMSTPMYFKHRIIRDKFLETFKDLLEIAKPFL